MIYNCREISIKFDGNCLRESNISFIHRNVVNKYISYKLDTWSRDLNMDFTTSGCLFGTVKLT